MLLESFCLFIFLATAIMGRALLWFKSVWGPRTQPLKSTSGREAAQEM